MIWPLCRPPPPSGAATGSAARPRRLESLVRLLADGLGHAAHFKAAQHNDDLAGRRIMTHGAPPRLCAGRRCARRRRGSVVNVKVWGAFIVGVSVGFPSTKRRSRFRIGSSGRRPHASSTAGEHGLFVMPEDQGKISTVSRSPPGLLSMRCCRARKAGRSSTKGARLP